MNAEPNSGYENSRAGPHWMDKFERDFIYSTPSTAFKGKCRKNGLLGR